MKANEINKIKETWYKVYLNLKTTERLTVIGKTNLTVTILRKKKTKKVKKKSQYYIICNTKKKGLLWKKEVLWKKITELQSILIDKEEIYNSFVNRENLQTRGNNE